jgi:succinate dehydrogenase hydrophobic anchor subunit
MRLAVIVIALVWCAAVLWHGWTTLPHVPLDVSASDPATVEALNAARLNHALIYAAAALLPAGAALWLSRLLGRS